MTPRQPGVISATISGPSQDGDAQPVEMRTSTAHPLTPEERSNLFLSAKEAMTMSSGIRRTEVWLRSDGGRPFHLELEDNGAGRPELRLARRNDWPICVHASPNSEAPSRCSPRGRGTKSLSPSLPIHVHSPRHREECGGFASLVRVIKARAIASASHLRTGREASGAFR